MAVLRLCRAILWNRLDMPGMEHLRLLEAEDGWIFEGTVVLSHPRGPAGLTYSIRADDRWRTREVTVRSVGPDSEQVVTARADGLGNWRAEATELPGLEGCLDVDLGFSPSTNTLPIRRLAIPVGGSAPITAAWLRFPELTWEPLPQTYTRVSEQRWEYRSPGFRRVLEVDELGLVQRYPDYWEAARPGVGDSTRG